MFKVAEDRKQSLEVFAQFDDTAEVYELFSDENGEGYVGCADTREECKEVAKSWFADRASW